MKNSFVAVFTIAGIAIVAACKSDDPAPANNASSSSSSSSSGGEDGGPDGTSSSGSSGDSAVKDDRVPPTTETVNVDGTQYSYLLVKPKAFDAAKEYPLILAFHGDGGNSGDMRYRYPIDAYSKEAAFVAFPSGNADWNLSTKYEDNPDQKIAQALVTQLAAKYKIDTKRVFGAGYSKGGFLINMIACRHEGLFRGLVTFESGEPDETDGDDRATTWPETGRTKCFNQTTAGMAIMTVQDPADGVGSGQSTAAYWALLNGCAEDATIATEPSPCKKHANCPADRPVVYCEVPGVGHQVWLQGIEPSWNFFKSL